MVQHYKVKVKVKFATNETGSFSFSFNSNAVNTSNQYILPKCNDYYKSFNKALNIFLQNKFGTTNKSSIPQITSSTSTSDSYTLYPTSLAFPGYADYPSYSTQTQTYTDCTCPYGYLNLNFILYGAGGGSSATAQGSGGGAFVSALNIPSVITYNNVYYQISNVVLENTNDGSATVSITFSNDYGKEVGSIVLTATRGADAQDQDGNGQPGGTASCTSTLSFYPSTNNTNLILVNGPTGGSSVTSNTRNPGTSNGYTVSGSADGCESWGTSTNTFNSTYTVSSHGGGSNGDCSGYGSGAYNDSGDGETKWGGPSLIYFYCSS